eukprot:689559-Amphidinium_carterae.2
MFIESTKSEAQRLDLKDSWDESLPGEMQAVQHFHWVLNAQLVNLTMRICCKMLRPTGQP